MTYFTILLQKVNPTMFGKNDPKCSVFKTRMFGKLTGKFSTTVQNINFKKSLKKLLHFLQKYHKLKTSE